MPAADDILKIGVDLDIKGAVREMAKLSRDMQKQFADATKASDKMGKAASRASKASAADALTWKKAMEEIGDEISDLEKGLYKMGITEKKQNLDTIKQLKAVQKQMKSARGAKKMSPFDARSMAEDARSAMAGAAEEFKSSISSFFQKDLKGTLSGLGKGFGKSLLGMAAKGGPALSRMGAKRKEAGGGTSMIGDVLGKMGGALKGIAKMAPALMTIGNVIMKIVMLMVDAESIAKDFNAEIMQSASSAEFLKENFGDADMAAKDLEKSLTEVRDAAMSWQNLQWGISAADHKAVLNVLNQEGVTLVRLKNEAKEAGMSLGEVTTQTTRLSVAMSRGFGVPLQEINQMQAEMFTDLGMNLDQTRMSFHQMSRVATDSGIASNKFFQTIRGVSQDLSLWNMRLGDSVKLLGMLGKVMSPRNAQKFFQQAMQGLKGMGRMQRVQVALLSRPGDILAKEQKKRHRDLAKMLNMGAGDVAKILATQGTRGLEDAISKLAKGKQGAAREFALKTEMAGKAARKGVTGQAAAMGMAGPGASAEIMARAVTSLAGGFGSLKDAIGGLGVEMTAEMLGVSSDDLQASAQLEYAVNLQRDTIQKQLAAGGSERLKALAALEAAGMKEKDVAKAGWDAIISTMGENEQKALKAGEKQMSPLEKMTKEQGQLTQSFLKKFEVLMDFIMNQIYALMTGMWEGIMEFANLFGDTDQEKMYELQKDIMNMEEGATKEKLKEKLKETAGLRAGDRMREIHAMAQPLLKADRKKKEDERTRAMFGLDKLLAPGKVLTEEQKQMGQMKGIMQSDIGATAKEFGVGKEDTAVMQKFADEIKNAVEAGWSDKQLLEQFGPGMAIAMKPFLEAKQKALEKGVTPEGTPVGVTGAGKPIKGMTLDEMHAQDTKILGKYEADKRKRENEALAKQMENDGTLITLGTDQSKGIKQLTGILKPNTAYFKFPGSYLRGAFTKAIETGVLDAMRVALFEYYMYSELDRGELAQKMLGGGMSIEALAKKAGTDPIKSGKALSEILGVKVAETGTKKDGKDPKKKDPKSGKKQHGGVVSHISGGEAIFRPPSGEGMTAIGVGERIVPAGPRGGGGGKTAHIQLRGDAMRLFEVIVDNRIIHHKSRERHG